MEQWDINVDSNNAIYIIETKNGLYKDFNKVEEIAKVSARQNKTIVKIKYISNEKEVLVADYRHSLLPNELINKQESEVKICKAELLVAKNELAKNKLKYKKSLVADQLENYRKYINSKNRVKNAQINLKEAKDKLKELLKYSELK